MKGGMMMKLSTLRYLFKEGLVGLWRNKTMALASIGTIILCLIILGMSFSIGENIDYILLQIQNRFGVTAFIEDEITKEDTKKLMDKIQSMPEVKEVIYISKEQALKDFSEKNEDESLFTVYKDDNPLPASFQIMTKNIELQESLIQKLNGMKAEGINDVKYFKEQTKMLTNIRDTVSYICYAILGCLIIVGIMLMSNTIKLTVFVRRKEINIMKYVGATDYFIQVPFIIEGISIGLIGAALSIMLVTLVYDIVLETSSMMAEYLLNIDLVPAGHIMSVLSPTFMCLGVSIGLVGSLIAIHKHLKV